mmetsp:Transcript_5177/g.14871  ORF Transcript_5177/g.14871 Transcript_5177/m.14871 type:complete len:205 (+) Transcript_5177:1814-2428(+)
MRKWSCIGWGTSLLCFTAPSSMHNFQAALSSPNACCSAASTQIVRSRHMMSISLATATFPGATRSPSSMVNCTTATKACSANCWVAARSWMAGSWLAESRLPRPLAQKLCISPGTPPQIVSTSALRVMLIVLRPEMNSARESLSEPAPKAMEAAPMARNAASATRRPATISRCIFSLSTTWGSSSAWMKSQSVAKAATCSRSSR